MVLIAAEEDIGARITETLRSRFVERGAVAAAHGDEFAALWRTAGDHVLGGKLIRPRLLLDMHRAMTVGGDPTVASDEIAVELSVSVELLHYAFLLHDDVIDGDLMRRRRPNFIGAIAHARGRTPQETDLHWARTSAILMGDLLMSAAVLGFARVEVAAQTRGRLLDLMDHVIMETVAGEHTDVGLSDGVIAPDLETVLAMTASKTASYSFALPLRAAAVLAGAPPAVETGMTAIGRHLGLAYQLQDDLLCVFGDSRDHGKDAFSDLREGKETAIIAFARQTEEWPSIEPLIGAANLSAEAAARARERLRACGAERYVRALVREQFDAVDAALAELQDSDSLSDGEAATVRALTERIGSRTA